MSVPEPTTPEPVRYWWFDGETVAELTRRLVATGPTARLEVHPHGNELTLEVVTPGMDAAARLKPLNESHPCPPDC